MHEYACPLCGWQCKNTSAARISAFIAAHDVEVHGLGVPPSDTPGPKSNG